MGRIVFTAASVAEERIDALEAEVAGIKDRAAAEASNPTATPGSIGRAVAGV